ncbi:ABC transporter permease subunit [Leeia sp. TBRC 13508]|uniref:ABC transporter permease subunit n=1 Tax=Leeia speluncae TaxID=2884804 RepID=A0ABS8DB98_9NEIS|nr:ABC transporter permease subunit [Leeia speluncae]MCB6185417.1 ABC transporter permease subunit [Leeia speluncae]
MSIWNDYVTLLTESGPDIWSGFKITLALLAGSLVVAFFLAIPLGIARSQTSGWASHAARVYSSIFRGTPLLVQIYLFYYGLSQFESVRDSFLWPVLGDSFYCGITVLALNLTAYMAEDIRAGILGVPHGEKEAAMAYGLSRFQCYRYIIVPRALGIVTPVLGNEVIAQLKATALVSTITVLDMTGVVRRLSANSFTIDALIVAGVVYALTTLLVSIIVKLIEHRNTRHLRR